MALATGLDHPFISQVLVPDYHEDRTKLNRYSQDALWRKVHERQWRLLYTLNDCRMQDPRREVRTYLNDVAVSLLGAPQVTLHHDRLIAKWGKWSVSCGGACHFTYCEFFYRASPQCFPAVLTAPDSFLCLPSPTTLAMVVVGLLLALPRAQRMRELDSLTPAPQACLIQDLSRLARR